MGEGYELYWFKRAIKSLFKSFGTKTLNNNNLHLKKSSHKASCKDYHSCAFREGRTLRTNIGKDKAERRQATTQSDPRHCQDISFFRKWLNYTWLSVLWHLAIFQHSESITFHQISRCQRVILYPLSPSTHINSKIVHINKYSTINKNLAGK